MINKKGIWIIIFLLALAGVIAQEFTINQPDEKSIIYRDQVNPTKYLKIETDQNYYRCLQDCVIKINISNTLFDQGKQPFAISLDNSKGYTTKKITTKTKLNLIHNQSDVLEYRLDGIPIGAGEFKFNVTLNMLNKEFVLDPIAISGCNETPDNIVECTRNISGTYIDVDNASIWIHDSENYVTSLIRINTSLSNGYINISNFTVTSSTDIKYYSDFMYIQDYSHTITGSSGSTGSTGSDCSSQNCYAGNGGQGTSGESLSFLINSTIEKINNFTLSLDGGQGGVGGQGGHCEQDYCHSGKSGKGGTGGSITVIIAYVNTTEWDENVYLKLSGGRGGDDGNPGGCNLGGGGWSYDSCGSDGNGYQSSGDGGLTTLTINGHISKMKNNYTDVNHGTAGAYYPDSNCDSCYYDYNNAHAGSDSTTQTQINIDTLLAYDNYNLSSSNPSANYGILNLSNPTEAKLGFFNGSDVKETFYVHCEAPDIIYGNDSTVTAPDPQLDWTNCPAYGDGNITYLDYTEFFNESSYPSDITIDSGNDGNIDYNYVETLNESTSPQAADLNITAINDYLATCTPDVSGYCDVPVVFSSATIGVVEYSHINITYYENVNQSKIGNDGTTNVSIYLLMKIQFWDGDSWIDEVTIQDDTSKRQIEPADLLNLDSIWNPISWSTSTSVHGTGTYRVYVAATDENNVVLQNRDGSDIISTFNFTLTSSFIVDDTYKFYIKDTSNNNIAWFGDKGNVVLKGTCTVSGTCTPPSNSFIIRDPSNNDVAYIDSNGNLCLESGTCNDEYANCDSPGDGSFIVRNESDTNVAYINATGNLCLIGSLIENW